MMIDLMFDIDILDDDKVFEEPMVFAATTTRSILVTTATSVEILDELTLAQTLIEIKSTKPKAVTTDATTVTPVFTRPKAKGFVFHDQDEQAPASKPIISPAQPSSKYKDLKSKATKDIISIGNFMEVLVLNNYVPCV
ncbi:hypothetical protein Tco_1407844 [Tanacetum coccineum]